MIKYILLASLLFNVIPSWSQHDFDSIYTASEQFKTAVDQIGKSLDIFNEEGPIDLTIVSDFKYLTRKKYDKKYQSAEFIWQYNDSVTVSRNIKIKTRGNYRLSNCPFPPLKIKFKKTDVLADNLQEFNKMKMVNNCRMQTSYEKYIIAEYLCYKLYNIITPNSFRVRLLDITYIDTGRKNKATQSYAFLIEPKEQLADRQNAIVINQKKIFPHQTNSVSENRMAMFQFMIGNTDYQIASLHNIVLLKELDHLKPDPIAVPYDFDYTGLVNSPYAIPSDLLPIENVRERLFLGACHDLSLFQNTAKYYQEKQNEIIECIESNEFLEAKYKKQMINYINQFYAILESKSGLSYQIISNCKD